MSCEHGNRRVSRTEPDGTVVTLVDSYQGKRLNSPNDLVVKSDDTIWFTDPPYGILSDYEGHKADSELGACYVFRFDPATGELRIVGNDFDRPNGICFSPDESVLYVADTGEPRNIRASTSWTASGWPTAASSRRSGQAPPTASAWTRRAISSPAPGTAYRSTAPAAELLGKILVPEQRTANCVFGGPDKSRLYIAADTSLYSVRLHTTGAQTP